MGIEDHEDRREQEPSARADKGAEAPYNEAEEREGDDRHEERG